MTDDIVKSSSNGSVQTRYSFYNAESELQQDEQNPQSKNGTSTNTTANGNDPALIPNNTSDDVEDILRSLKETEHLGFHKRHQEGGGGITSTNGVNDDDGGDVDDHENGLQQFENDFNPFSNLNLESSKDPQSSMSQNQTLNARNNLQNNLQNNHSQDSHYEKAVREALYHIRLRSHKRATYLQPATTIASASTGATANNNSSSNDTTPELGSTSGSGSISTGLPLHPTTNNGTATTTTTTSAALVNATKLDDRLLSLPADVRKAVELSAVEMFRPYDTNYNNHNNDDTINEMNKEEKEACNNDTKKYKTNLSSSMTGLHLANPVFSTLGQQQQLLQPQQHHATNESPMHTMVGTTNSTAAASSSSQPPFSVVPSSPAPGKFNHLMNNKQTTSSTVEIAAATAAASDALMIQQQQQQQRQQIMELELQQQQYRREEEIEKGVEQVLLAILQSVPNHPKNQDIQNNGDTTTSSVIDDAFSALSGNGGGATTGRAGATSLSPLETNGVVDNDDILDGIVENTIPRTPSKTCSVVDELLAETDDEESEILPRENDGGDDVDDATQQMAPQAPLDAVDESNPTTTNSALSSKKNNASIRPYTVEADGTLEVEAVDKGSRHSSLSEVVDDQDGNDLVLGPLNKVSGGTTGVVLHDTKEEDYQDTEDDDDYEDDDEEEEEEEDDDDDDDDDDGEEFGKHEMEMEKVKKGSNNHKNYQGNAKSSMKIIESLTNAVRNNSKASDLISKFSGDKKRGEEISLPRRGSLPKIKELYAHMLPYQSNKGALKKNPALVTWFTEKLSGVFNTAPPVHPWDDEDPDELGYIIHTFSRLQLQLIEQDYDELLEKINKKFDAAMKKGLVRVPPKKKTDATEKSKKLSPSKQRNKKVPGPNSARRAEENRVGMGERRLINDRLATNPNFPNAKPAGSGDVGELEIYHLPIIYKAQQTGFEPTKDLVLQPDTVFAGNYYVQSELGSAAFSTAYRCVDLNSGKEGDDGETYYDEVCLKVIKNTKDFFDQSLDEIKILELLRQTNQCHENNILEMKTFFYHKEHLIIVTELLRQNLFEFGKYITENEEPQYFTRDRLCYITRQCLVSLSFVHNLGLVHSDIKPENILLASYSRARVKVIDFGSSCYLTDRQSSYIQSRSYRAPEVVLGLPYSGKIDIWSLGCVIAEMYTGQVTFQNDSVVTMLSRIEAICGAFPRHMIEKGRQSGQFFTPTGLLYEKSDYDDDSEARLNQTPSTYDEDSSNGDNELFNVFQPKITTMAARLGFEPNLMENKRTTWEEEEKALFVDFVTKLLTIDPDKRPTADEALAHPWILSGYNLNEEDLKYPPGE